MIEKEIGKNREANGEDDQYGKEIKRMAENFERQDAKVSEGETDDLIAYEMLGIDYESQVYAVENIIRDNYFNLKNKEANLTKEEKKKFAVVEPLYKKVFEGGESSDSVIKDIIRKLQREESLKDAKNIFRDSGKSFHKKAM